MKRVFTSFSTIHAWVCLCVCVCVYSAMSEVISCSSGPGRSTDHWRPPCSNDYWLLIDSFIKCELLRLVPNRRVCVKTFSAGFWCSLCGYCAARGGCCNWATTKGKIQNQSFFVWDIEVYHTHHKQVLCVWCLLRETIWFSFDCTYLVTILDVRLPSTWYLMS